MEQPSTRRKTNKSERKYQVFISSTFGDLADQRRMVLDVVVDRGHMPVALERFPAADTTVPYVIQKTIEASQIYVVILGFRYGAIVDSRGISFTQLEYEDALSQQIIVVPFILSDAEVEEKRAALREDLDRARIDVQRFGPETLEHKNLSRKIENLDQELGNEKKLWAFRSRVQEGRFSQLFSLRRGIEESGSRVEQFDKSMVLKSLLEAEEAAVERRISGWIREPENGEIAETLEAVSRNRFLVDVVGAMAKFDRLDPRVRDQSDEKSAAASFFADKYLQPLLAKNVSLFFESGSTVAYVAHAVGERIKNQRKEVQISTNNVLAYLIFWLVHRIRCSLFPWGPPEEQYGAVFGPVNEFVPEEKRPFFPPEPLSGEDVEAIDLLRDGPDSPAKWKTPAMMLGALSGLQLSQDPNTSNCLGPHVGSPRNKVFKRFMYATKLPLMFFMTTAKIDRPVDPEHCHFILEQKEGQDLPWEVFIRDQPVAFCVGCKNESAEIDKQARRFEDLGFSVIRAEHKTPYTAFIARNQKFIDAVETKLNIRL